MATGVGALMPGLGRAAQPCPPPLVSASGGTSASTSCTFVSPSKPATAPAWVQGLPLLTWKELPNTSMTRVGSGRGITAYSGGCLKTSGSQLLIFGGGHSDYSGNEVNSVALGADNPVSTQLTAASANTPGNVAHYPDGRPSSRHTFGSLQFSDINNRMISLDCMFPNNNGAPTTWFPDIDAFSLDSNTWLPAKTYADGPPAQNTANSSCKDAAGNVYLWHESSGILWKLPAGATRGADTGAKVPGAIYNFDLKCDTLRNRIVIFCPTPCSLDVGNNFARTNVSFGGSSAGAGTRSASWAYCPERDSFIGIMFGTSPTIFECNASTLAINTLPVAGAPPSGLPSDGNNNYFGRFGYAPELRGFYFLPDAAHNVWFFRTA